MNLENEHIVSFIDSFYEGIMFCTVTEYCEVISLAKKKEKIFIYRVYKFLLKKGGDLAKKIKEKIRKKEEFNYDTIFRWTNEIINGIYYLHYNSTQKCIHRDLNPR